MRWTPGGRSDDLEDRRGESGGGGRMLGGGGLRIGAGGALLLLVLSLATGQNFFALLGNVIDIGGPQSGGQVDAPRESSPDEEKLVEFVSFVIDDVQGTWEKAFPIAARNYRRAKLVLFTDAVRSGCGFAEAAMGPFYCPADEKVYIDLGFYHELRSRFGAPGDFAQAYVIAHEFGHHVQNVLGLSDRVREMQQRKPDVANQLSVLLELQADCFAGVWAHSTEQRDILERGDVEEGIGAAAAVGDDRIQKQAGGAVNPETWTHGSSQQRVGWFQRGRKSGTVADCNTFAAAQ
ncbi:MAG: putative neutral zinc metallopeptidase [Deltaproteobacteria bacterium]|nr:putative neutral zinc metallopeptidase [Deltaproteobacteria bacterium]